MTADLTRLAAEGIVLAPARELPPYNPVASHVGTMPPYMDQPPYVPQAPPPVPDGAGRDPQDPPIFLLQASAAFAPWLPDTVYQRVPIGSTGQVLAVQADGSIAWVTGAGGGFTNPMTTLGDLIQGGSGGTPLRLAIGTAGQALVVSGGVPTWSSSVLVNPMSAAGDIIYGGVAGAPLRLPTGTVGQLLTNNGSPAWGQGPMTALGDLLVGGAGGFTSVPTRLPIGSNGQVLTVSGGTATWQNASAGFTNPMVNTGDMIYSSPGSTPVNLGIGTPGQVLTASGGLPTWQTPGAAASLPFTVIFPSGDTSGTTDANAIKAAVTAMSPPNTPHGGQIFLATGDFYVKVPAGNPAGVCINLTQNTTTTPNNGGQPVSLCGVGPSTRIFPVGAGVTGIYMHRTTSYGAQYGIPAQQQTASITDLVIDGTNTTGASIGLDWGDGWGYNFNIGVVNFDTAGAIGVQQINRQFWTEKNTPCIFRLSNNTTAMYITSALVPGGDISSEYNTYFITMFCQANQQGVVVDGCNMGGSHMWIQGNMSVSNGSGPAPPGNIAALSVINASGATISSAHRWYEGSIWIKVEGNPGNGSGTTFPYLLYSDGVGYIRNCFGGLWQSSLTNSNWNGAEFTFSGATDDPNLAGLVNGFITTGAGTGGTIIGETISGTGTVLQVVNFGTTPTSVPVQFLAKAAGDHLVGVGVSGETNMRWKVDSGGDTQWGAGGASVTDVDLKRTAVGTLTMSDGTNANNNVQLKIQGTSGANQSNLFIANGAIPTTPTGGGILYVAAGALHYKGSSGTDTPLAPA